MSQSNRISRKKKEKPTLPKIGKRKVKSEYEFTIYKQALSFLPKGWAVEYETETIPYIEEKEYRPDFPVTKKDGTKFYIESKGFFPYPDRAKMVAVKAGNPNVDIRFVFYRDNPSQLGRGSKSRPSDWALKNGFKFAIGSVPEEWFEE
jgi:hypothetical protein